MATTRELLGTARTTMSKWPALWLPAIMINAFQSLAGIPLSTVALQGIVGVTANLGAFLLQAGWLSMIAEGLRGERPRFSHFNEGVNRHWGAMIAGNLAYLLVLGLLLAGFVFYGDQQHTLSALTQWYAGLKDATPAQLQAALQPERIPLPVRGWMTLFLGWSALAAFVTFLLLFWQPLVVLRGMRWWRAWGASVKLVFRRFGQTASFALLHLLAFMTSLMLAAAGNPIMALVGLTLLLFVMIFFKILYAAVVDDALPAPAAHVDATA